MKRGNCLFGAIALMIRLRTWKIYMIGSRKPDGRNSRVPHFVVEDRKGNLWHFYRTRDLLPYPLCFFWFEGKMCIYKDAERRLWDMISAHRPRPLTKKERKELAEFDNSYQQVISSLQWPDEIFDNSH